MLFELRDIKKSFGDLQVLKGVSVRINRGDVVGILGPNGAGKTTTMKIASLLLKPTHGDIIFDGEDVLKNKLSYLSHLGYVPETPVFYNDLTGEEILDLMGELRGKRIKKEEERLITLFGINKKIATPTGNYSKGERKVLSIIIALNHAPSLLLLDEPTSGLDPGHVHTFKKLLLRQKIKGVGVLLSTHITSIAEEVCDKVGIIVDGRLKGPEKKEILMKKCGSNNLEEVFLKAVR